MLTHEALAYEAVNFGAQGGVGLQAERLFEVGARDRAIALP